MEGQVIVHATINRPDLRRPFPHDMAARLAGQRVLVLRRRSKYILADLASGETLLIHLGMSGRILVSDDPLGQFAHAHASSERHAHVVLDMANGARITFNDPRRFGAMDLMPTQDAEAHPLLARLGPEPLGNSFDGPYLTAALRSRNTPIKSALLDQHILAGLGNIYVCETLYRARISPRRRARNISAARAAALVAIIREVLTDAIEAGGSSLRDFRHADGELGYFQHSFAVYGREGEPCHSPGCPSRIVRIVQSGRSSFYCPLCQR